MILLTKKTIDDMSATIAYSDHAQTKVKNVAMNSKICDPHSHNYMLVVILYFDPQPSTLGVYITKIVIPIILESRIQIADPKNIFIFVPLELLV